MKCTSCGFENRQGVNFCEQCGFSLSEAAYHSKPVVPITNFCPQCGFSNRLDINFCEHCGLEIAKFRTEVQPRQVHPQIRPCLKCGFNNRLGVKFCEQCGFKLASVSEPTSTQKSIPAPKKISSAGAVLGGAGLLGILGIGALLLGALFLANGGARNSSSSGINSPASPNQSGGAGDTSALGGTPTVTVSPTSGTLPVTFSVRGTGFLPNESIVVILFIKVTNGYIIQNVFDLNYVWAETNKTPYGAAGENTSKLNFIGITDSLGNFSLEIAFESLLPDSQNIRGQTIPYVLQVQYGDNKKFPYSKLGETLFFSNEFDVHVPGNGLSLENEQGSGQNAQGTGSCAPGAVVLSVSPRNGALDTFFNVTVKGASTYQGDQLYLYVRNPDGNHLYTTGIDIDEKCTGQSEITLMFEDEVKPGLYTLLLVKPVENKNIATTTFEIVAEAASADTAIADCGSDEYNRSALEFNKLLTYWFGEIDFYWLSTFDQYFTYRFPNGGYYSPRLLINPSPTFCDDSEGYNAQYLSNFNVTTGAMTVNEIRFDGPAFMDSYLEWREVVPLVVLSHEFGHVVQIQGGLIQPTSPAGKQGELQADCLSGVFLEYAFEQGMFSPLMLEQAIKFHGESGDVEGTGIQHGSSTERSNALVTGIERGTPACLANYKP